MKKTVLTLMSLLLLANFSQVFANDPEPPTRKSKIQIALLLDTSGSMSGLINQARSQLWKLVNTLATAEKNGQMPDIELALYQYGNSSLPASENYIEQKAALTPDLDLVSERLFSLSTSGGSEYCGAVIDCAVKQLNWSNSPGDLKLIYIAGNEEFTQGGISYKEACKKAIAKGIIVNTIFCGPAQEGINTMWKDGADLADGEYMNIDQSQAVVHISSPYDQQIMQLNQKLNQTYIYYGQEGYYFNQRMVQQDSTSTLFGSGNGVERAVSKTNANYNNYSWDLVDYYKTNQKLPEFKKEDLPENLRGQSKAEIQDAVEEKLAERNRIQLEIAELNQKREAHVTAERAKMGNSETLDQAVQQSMKRQAKKLNYNFK